MTTFGVIYLAVLISASACCILWWMLKVLSSDVVGVILTALVVVGWIVYGYLSF